MLHWAFNAHKHKNSVNNSPKKAKCVEVFRSLCPKCMHTTFMFGTNVCGCHGVPYDWTVLSALVTDVHSENENLEDQGFDKNKKSIFSGRDFCFFEMFTLLNYCISKTLFHYYQLLGFYKILPLKNWINCCSPSECREPSVSSILIWNIWTICHRSTEQCVIFHMEMLSISQLHPLSVFPVPSRCLQNWRIETHLDIVCVCVYAWRASAL